MDTQDNVADATQAPIDVVTTATADNFASVSQAARALAQARHARNKEQQPAEQSGAESSFAPSAFAPRRAWADERGASEDRSAGATDQPQEPAEAPRSGAEADAAAADTEAAGETEGGDPAEPPAIEPPRSWTKEDKELFASLPRETQVRVAERERSRESDFLRRQNEAVEQLKGLAAKEQATDQARRHYEGALPAVLQLIQAQHADEFADIKSQADVERMAKEDMPRYVKWSESQRQIGRAIDEVKAAQESALREAQQKWFEFATRQDALFAERVPEAADPEKAAKLQQAAVAVLKDIGWPLRRPCS
jgi:hypothetical protein